jgi:hypothetical protein
MQIDFVAYRSILVAHDVQLLLVGPKQVAHWELQAWQLKVLWFMNVNEGQFATQEPKLKNCPPKQDEQFEEDDPEQELQVGSQARHVELSW